MCQDNEDIKLAFQKINSINNELSNKYIMKNGYFLVANTHNFYPDTIQLTKLKAIQLIQKSFDEEVMNILNEIDQYGIPVVGLKGIFLKQYYENNTRFYSDIDLFILNQNAYSLTKKILSMGFIPKHFKYPLYNKKILLEIFRSKYFKNIAHMELKKNIPLKGMDFDFCIEIHSNLNISTNVKLNHEVLFYSAKPFECFTNVKVLDEYDNILFLIYHISKHLSFAYPYATSLHVDFKMMVDIRNIILTMDSFNQDHLIQKAKFYNLIPQLVFFEFLYNNIFPSCNKFELNKPISLLETCKCEWKGLLQKIITSNPIRILIGDYDSVCPGFNSFHQSLESISNQNIRALLIRRYINKIK